MRFQIPIKGGRKSLSSGVLKEIRRRVEQDANTYGCSLSYVVSTVLGEYYGIKQEKYYDRRK